MRYAAVTAAHPINRGARSGTGGGRRVQEPAANLPRRPEVPKTGKQWHGAGRQRTSPPGDGARSTVPEFGRRAAGGMIAVPAAVCRRRAQPRDGDRPQLGGCRATIAPRYPAKNQALACRTTGPSIENPHGWPGDMAQEARAGWDVLSCQRRVQVAGAALRRRPGADCTIAG